MGRRGDRGGGALRRGAGGTAANAAANATATTATATTATVAGATAIAAAALVWPAAPAAALSCALREMTVEQAVEDMRREEVVFLGRKERGLVGLDQYVVLEVYAGGVGGRVLVERMGAWDRVPDGTTRLIRGDDPPGTAGVSVQDPCGVTIRSAPDEDTADEALAHRAFGDPREPGTTGTSALLTAVEYPLRLLSQWVVWAVIVAALLAAYAFREVRARYG